MQVIAVVGRGRSLEVALSLGVGDVTALALVPPDGEALLAAARSAGASRAVAVWDESLRDTDYYGAAQTLASAVQKLDGTVIVCGESPWGLLAPALADRLGVPHVSGVVSAELRDGQVVAARPVAGRLHLLGATPPLVLGVAGAAAPLSTTEGQPIERLTLAAIGIAPAELRWRRRFAAAPASRAGASQPPGTSSARPPLTRPLVLPDPRSLVERLRAEGLLPPTGGTP